MIKQIRASYFANFKNAQYCALSTDPIPDYLKNGDEVYMIDTGKNYIWDAISSDLYEDKSGGGSSGVVDDVQINNTSIVDENGVANINKASTSTLGVIMVGTGLAIGSTGILRPNGGNASDRKAGTSLYIPTVMSTQHESTFYGLAKAAGDSTQSASANPVGQYTEEAKSAIYGMLNAPVTVSGTTPTITAKDGITYVCGEVATLDITLPASGIFEVQFASGSTPTVLTATGVSWVGGFNPTDLEANKTYDISISNGIGVAVWT